MRTSPAPSTVVLWRGPSPVDGAPIMAVMSGLRDASRNAKTGPMSQVWILREDVRPMAALATGADVSICGGCPHRMGGAYGKRTCYVNVANAPTAVWDSVARGGVPNASENDANVYGVRMGAYGDPALIPSHVWDAAVASRPFHTAYTHFWRSARIAGHVRGRAMASCETPEDVEKANAKGWGTFRVIGQSETPPTNGVECPATGDGRVTCATCRKCDGTPGRNVWIRAHGVGGKRVRTLPVL
jgi:hypothetical protein